MKVYQLTLKGWSATNATSQSEACIKWVKASDRGWIWAWLREHGIDSIVTEIDDNPLPDYGFEDGVDVILHPDEPMCEEWSPAHLEYVAERNRLNETDLAPHHFWLIESVLAGMGVSS